MSTNVKKTPTRRNIPEVTILVGEASELLEDLGVHVVGRNIDIGDVLAKLFTQLRLDLLEVERLHGQTGPTSDSCSVTDDVGSQRLRESPVRFTEVSLEEFDNTFGEVQAVGFFENVFLCQVVRNHELRKVADYLTVIRNIYVRNSSQQGPDESYLEGVTLMISPQSWFA